jgi:hypothetical protein
MKEYKGQLISKEFKYAIVVSRFNQFITDKLLEGAIDALTRSGAKDNEIDVFRVPGSLPARRSMMPSSAWEPSSGEKLPILTILPPKCQKESPY